MIRRPPRSTRTDTLFPYTTLFRSLRVLALVLGVPPSVGTLEPTPLILCSSTVRAVGTWPICQAAMADSMRLEAGVDAIRSEEHTSELQSLMRISYAVFCLKKNNKTVNKT